MGVAPLGSFTTSPLGVKQNTWSEYISSLTCFEELVVSSAVVKPFGQTRDPFGRIDGKGVLDPDAVAVGPMRGNARFGHVMHLAGADLHLDPFAVAARHGGVDRPVAVRFGLADVILEPPRHRAPALVDRAEDAVAIILGAGDDAEAVDVGQARKGEILFLHLAPDRKGFLGAAKDIGLSPCLSSTASISSVMRGMTSPVSFCSVTKRRMIEVRASGLRTRKDRSSSSSRIHCMPIRPASGA
jgi:hypothetical protein